MDNTFFTKEGKKVSLGEPFKAKFEEFDKENRKVSISTYSVSNLSPYLAESLVKKGVLFRANPSKKKEETSTEIDMNEVLDLIGKWVVKEGADHKMVTALLGLMPDYASFAVLLRAVAVIIDRKYPDHINNAAVDKYFTLDMSNGRVCEVPKGRIKNFRCFAAFRTLEDIKIATKLLRPLIKVLWPNE